MSSLTQKALRQNIAELLQSKSLDDITVKEVVERCGINRKTFYRHYRNLPDLIAGCAADELTAAIGDNFYPENWEAGVTSGMQWLKDHRRIVRHCYDSSYYDEIRRYLTPSLDALLEKNIDRALKIYRSNTGRNLIFTDREFHMIRHYFASIVFTFLEEWIASGMQDKPDNYVDTMSLLIHDDMYPMFDRIYERHQAVSS